jgi:hypothetical protein
MKLQILILCSVLSSFTAFGATLGRFSDESNQQLIQNVSNRTCDQILSILLDTNAEANRLSEAAFVRLEADENNEIGTALAVLAEGAYKRSDLLKELLVVKCFKN